MIEDNSLVFYIETPTEKLKTKLKLKITELKEELDDNEKLLEMVCEKEGFEKLTTNLNKYPYWVRDGNVIVLDDVYWNRCVVKWHIDKSEIIHESTFVEFSAWFSPYEGITY